jgi:hypothetical protein
MPIGTDAAEYVLLALPEAAVVAALSTGDAPAWRIRLLGNRQGIASLASVLLWLHANTYRREFLSLTALPFVEPENGLAITVRVSEGEGSDFGRVRRLDGAFEFEWELAEDDLQALALRLHHLACVPEQEYDLIEVGSTGEARVEIRLSDARATFSERRA